LLPYSKHAELFPTTYKRITARGLEALQNDEFESPEWGEKIIVDFASRNMENLHKALVGDKTSYAWERYYRMADQSDVSKVRSVVIAFCAHLMFDFHTASLPSTPKKSTSKTSSSSVS
jgi:hypothetical protein